MYKKIIKSPLQKTNCIGFQINVGREMSNGYDDEYITEEVIQNFYLEDNNEKILVIPNDARVLLKKENIGNSGLLKDISINMSAFLKRHRVNPQSLGLNKSLNFKEGTLKKGDQVIVIGKLSVLKLRNKETLLVIRKLERFPLIISHVHNIGEIL